MIEGLWLLWIAFAIAAAGVVVIILWAARLSRRQERRRHPRERLVARGHLVFEGHRIACSIIDISVGGARLVADKGIPVGAAVSLQLPHYGSIPGKVVHQHKDAVGVAFERELPALLRVG